MGKRKRQQGRVQHYHGRGSHHVHALLCSRRPRESTLLDNVSATESDLSTLMTCLVKKSQESYSGSGWQVQTEPNRWVESDDVLQLRHTQHDFDNGVRAYFPILMESPRCHMDLAMSDGRGMLLRYVAGYVPKYSFSFATDWLNDDASTSSVTRRILHDYHPLEPEMLLQLFNNNIPQCCQGRTMQRYIVPVAWQRDLEERAMQYCQCDWRNDDMTLWRFLRVTNRKGQAHRFVRQAAKEAGENDVTKFALNCESKGKVLIATVTQSRYRDEFYDQWLVLHVPFRNVDELWTERTHLMYLALCLENRPQYWRNMNAIQQDLELESSTSVATVYSTDTETRCLRRTQDTATIANHGRTSMLHRRSGCSQKPR